MRGRLVAGDIEVEQGHVAAVGVGGKSSSRIAMPGFVDLQVNGFAGIDFLSASTDDYDAVSSHLLATGVTAFQPTFITSSESSLVAALDAVPYQQLRPRVIGAHLEGPFLSPKRLGVHPPQHRRDPDLSLLNRLIARGRVTQMTLAPELPGAAELVKRLLLRGILVSAGHTDATAEDAHRFFDSGVRTVTHLLNAMRPVASRDPGIAAVALSRKDVIVQVIADGFHLSADTIRLIWAAAPGRVAVVSDATAASGTAPGEYRLGSTTLHAASGAPRRADGVLAGSAGTLIEAVRSLIGQGVDFAGAVNAVTLLPSRVLRRTDLGQLDVGSPADVVVLDDRLEVIQVLAAGQAVDL